MAVYELYEKNSYVFFDVEDARVLSNLNNLFYVTKLCVLELQKVELCYS